MPSRDRDRFQKYKSGFQKRQKSLRNGAAKVGVLPINRYFDQQVMIPVDADAVSAPDSEGGLNPAIASVQTTADSMPIVNRPNELNKEQMQLGIHAFHQILVTEPGVPITAINFSVSYGDKLHR